MEVVYIQHKGEDGGILAEGTHGWMIYDEIAPVLGEAVISKSFNSSFRDTELRNHLEEREIDNLIVTGMQIEYCIDTTCRVAFEFGYSIIVPEITNTTYDNGLLKAKEIYEYHNHKIFKNRFGIVENVEKTIERIVGD